MTEPPLPVDRYFNRELSWLEFNQRVLDHAADPRQPLLERAKFLAIVSSNLDEFFMVRVGGLKLQAVQNAGIREPSGMTVSEQLLAIADRCHRMQADQYRILNDDLFPALAQNGIQHIDHSAYSARHQQSARSVFEDVSATLSPHALDPSRPLPLLQGLQLHLCVRLKSEADSEQPWQFAFIPLGRAMSRLVSLPSDRGYQFTLLEDIVSYHVAELFPGRQVLECVAFRITRNADIKLREDHAPDLMLGMEEVLESRKESGCVRLELASDASEHITAFLTETLEVTLDDLFLVDGPIDLGSLFQLTALEGFDELKDRPWRGQGSPDIDPAEPMFETIAKGDLVLVHPYERFDPVVRLIEEAAVDPDVLAIKQVLYRTSRNSPIVAALKRAAERGKYVTAIVELKARFDEQRNMEWAREMEHAGVQVIYGIKGLKTHAKICIIVRSEPHGIVRYVHYGTGNYNEATSRLYSDVSLLTCDEELGADATTFFNAVTGASHPLKYHKIAAAPTTLRSRIKDLIDAEIARKRDGQKAEISVKVNSLVDPQLIDALYRASQAGVRVRLNVRGICCLRPGVDGLSENIVVTSIVDRFLEHARILHFHHGGDDQVLISSADWMPRNLDRRIELLVPIESPQWRKRLIRVLQTYFKDNRSAWNLTSSGRWKRIQPPPEGEAVQAQRLLYEAAVGAVQQADQHRRTAFETHDPPALKDH
ncbi:polyphosphate kinase 1 [Roseimaritima ulvae]|nr:polyphosphate kinase 1 [Roseimaritima ulvae]